MAYIYQQSFPVTQQPQSRTPPNIFRQNNSSWNVELCDCCNDLGQCAYAYFCWCCFLASLAEDINEPKMSCCCVPNILTVYRMKIRSTLKIQGDACSDCCTVCCCPLCAGLQMRNELKRRGLS